MSQAQIVAFLIIIPFVGVFIYAGWHEYRRYKAKGASSYGLTYDPDTNTTHVGTIEDDADSYDPDDFDPELTDAIAAEDQNTADETEDTEQETRT